MLRPPYLNLFSPIRSGGDDDIFGSKVARKVGESWPLDSKGAAKWATGEGVTVDKKDVGGTMTLKGVENANGGKVLRISGTIAMKNLKMPALPGATVQSCEMKAQFTGLYPVNFALPVVENEMSGDITMRISANGMNVEVKAHKTLKEVTTPVKK